MKLSGPTDSAKIIIGFIVMFPGIVIGNVCVYLMGAHKIKMQNQHTAILKDPILMKQFRQTHIIQ